MNSIIFAPVALSILLLVFSAYSIRSKKLNNTQVAIWSSASILLCVSSLIFTTKLFASISNSLGFKYPPSLAFLLCIFMLFFLCLLLSIQNSKQSEQIKEIVQELSLLENFVKNNQFK